MNPIVRFGIGRDARRAAERYADEQWMHGRPARAVFKPNMRGWVVMIYDPPTSAAAIRIAGGVLWRLAEHGVEVALVHRPDYDDWTLPRGKLQAGEHPLVGAARAALDQTGLRVVVERQLPVQHHVRYWSMRALDGTASPDEVAWLPPAEAHRRVSHPDDVGLLDALGPVPVDSALLLVRHAAAGDPDQWSGDDAQRPLDADGRSQAAALRRVLPLFGVSRVLSVPNVRCVDTVAPMAMDLGLVVQYDTALSEEGYARRPDLGLRRIRELAAESGTAIVCSQGTVIPDVVTALAADGAVPLPAVKAKKGSVWALFFHRARLRAADYYPTLG